MGLLGKRARRAWAICAVGAEGRKETSPHEGNQRVWLKNEVESTLKWENSQDLRVNRRKAKEVQITLRPR